MRVGLVVHPERDIDEELAALRGWAREGEGMLVQVGAQEREVAERASAETCDLVVTLGGDGTALEGIRVGGEAGRPVLGVACGSLGVLTAVTAAELTDALDRFSAGQWRAREAPALEVTSGQGTRLALNDLALVRAGEGQVTTTAHADGVLYARFVGDGFVVSTPVGSSAYTLAAGGPLVAPGTPAFVFSPLSSHGGSCPPLVLGPGSELGLEIDEGHAGARLEVDGTSVGSPANEMSVTLRADVARLVTFDDTESLLAGLRRRRIIMDSPRVLTRDERDDG